MQHPDTQFGDETFTPAQEKVSTVAHILEASLRPWHQNAGDSPAEVLSCASLRLEFSDGGGRILPGLDFDTLGHCTDFMRAGDEGTVAALVVLSEPKHWALERLREPAGSLRRPRIQVDAYVGAFDRLEVVANPVRTSDGKGSLVCDFVEGTAPCERVVFFSRPSLAWRSAAAFSPVNPSAQVALESSTGLQVRCQTLVLCDVLRRLSAATHVRVGQWPMLGEDGMEFLGAAARANRSLTGQAGQPAANIRATTDMRRPPSAPPNRAAAVRKELELLNEKHLHANSLEHLMALFARFPAGYRDVSNELKALVGMRPRPADIHKARNLVGWLANAAPKAVREAAEHAA